MKRDRMESLVNWFFTGGILISVGLFFLIRGWFFPQLGVEPVRHGGTLDPQLALGGGVLFLLIGAVMVLCAVIGKLRTRR
jgi:uncharacterized membrane protein